MNQRTAEIMAELRSVVAGAIADNDARIEQIKTSIRYAPTRLAELDLSGLDLSGWE